jgi:hypothetical protein
MVSLFIIIIERQGQPILRSVVREVAKLSPGSHGFSASPEAPRARLGAKGARKLSRGVEGLPHKRSYVGQPSRLALVARR